MNDDINRKKALYNKLSEQLSRKSREDNFPQDKLQKLLKLKKETAKAIGREARELENKPQVVKNVTEHMKTNEVIGKVPNATDNIKTKQSGKLLKGNEFLDKIASKRAALKKVSKGMGKKLLGSIPLVGGLAAALASGDVSAAVPVVSEIDSLGPREGSDESRLEDMSLPMEERIKLLKAIQKKKGQ